MLEISSFETLYLRSTMRSDCRESVHWTLLDFLCGQFLFANFFSLFSKWLDCCMIYFTSRLKSESTSSCSSTPSLSSRFTNYTCILLFVPFKGTVGLYGDDIIACSPAMGGKYRTWLLSTDFLSLKLTTRSSSHFSPISLLILAFLTLPPLKCLYVEEPLLYLSCCAEVWCCIWDA